MAFKIISVTLLVLTCNSFSMVTTGGLVNFDVKGTFQSGVMESKALLGTAVILKCSVREMNSSNCKIIHRYEHRDQEKILISDGGIAAVSAIRKFEPSDSGYYTCICETHNISLNRRIKIEAMNSKESCFVDNGPEVVIDTAIIHHCFSEKSGKVGKISRWYHISDTGVAHIECPNSDCYSEVTCVSRPSISLHPKSFHSPSSNEIEFVCETRPPTSDANWMINDMSVDTYASGESLKLVITETSGSSALVVKEIPHTLKNVTCYYHQGETMVKAHSVYVHYDTSIDDSSNSEEEVDLTGGISKVVIIAIASSLGFTAVFLFFCIVLHLKCLSNIRQELKYVTEGDSQAEVPKKRVKSSKKHLLPYAISQRVSIFAFNEDDEKTVVKPETSVQQSNAKAFTNDVLTLDKLEEDGEIRHNPVYETCGDPNEIYI